MTSLGVRLTRNWSARWVSDLSQPPLFGTGIRLRADIGRTVEGDE